MNNLYNEELIIERGFRCKDCSKLMHEHSFSGKYMLTGVKDRWGGEEKEFAFDESCSINFRDKAQFWNPKVSYPNLIRVDGRWYYFSHRAVILSLITKADIHLRVDSRNALVDPKPTSVDTFGDMYNFAVTQGILDKLRKVMDVATFKSMQSKSIVRALKKLSTPDA